MTWLPMKWWDEYEARWWNEYFRKSAVETYERIERDRRAASLSSGDPGGSK